MSYVNTPNRATLFSDMERARFVANVLSLASTLLNGDGPTILKEVLCPALLT